ncbi:MAG: ABC transporter ATP-binding protein [Spirochaetales bacterium]|nr:ABC transporter ATP-binding protein [Spirochaetales bacterium]
MSNISIKALCKDYYLGKTIVHALKNINLEIATGSFVCVAGPSGSGKTTLLNIIGLIDEATKGDVHIAGEDIQALSEKLRTRYRNQTLGFIFQSFNLMPVLNIYENIHLPLILHKELSKKEKNARIMELIEAVGLTEYIKHKPYELSGGQRQRVAIARALVTHPKIVLADEPTANLDSVTGSEVLTLMQSINKSRGTTFIFSSHDQHIMDRAERAIRLRDGKLEEA